MSELPLIIAPDEDEPDCAQIWVEGWIADRSYRFRLDTGAGSSTICADEFTDTFPRVGEKHGSGVFGSGTALLVEVPSVTVGSLSVDKARMTRGGSETLLGMDLLKDHVLSFDFARAVLCMDEPADLQSDGSPLFMAKTGHPYLDVDIDGVVASAVWDSGAGITVVDESFRRDHSESFLPSTFSVGTDSGGTSVETATWTASESYIGGQRFAPHRVAAVDLSGVNETIERRMDFILGYPVLHQANWCFDFPRRLWSVRSLAG